jgi:ribosomal protein S18 acetylase RimI-like enzyme
MAGTKMTTTFVEITGYNPAYKQAFHDMNIAWLEKYFTVEPVHRQMLENPEEELVSCGGEVFFAVRGSEVLGTVGVRNAGGGIYELTKLAVSPAAQGMGLGRLLCETVIDFFQSEGGKTLYLETHNKLKPALHIYKSLNFKIAKNPDSKHYDGCDLYMEWQGT